MSECDSTEEGCRSRSVDVAIVGGGFSGVSVAVHLLRNGFPGQIAIVEMHSTLGLGLAYSTPFEQHLLNVPARNMSALPSEPGHFVEWLDRRNWPGTSPDLFAPRRLYGEYVAALLQTEIRNARPGAIRSVQEEVTDIQPLTGGLELILGDGSAIKTRQAVLALGNPASSTPVASATLELDDLWHPSPWIGAALRAPFAGEKSY
jgi:uncharacterized NAD(P)/FAD-binding protein YdhS